VTSAAATTIAPIPSGLKAIGAAEAPFRPALRVTDLPAGAMARATFGDLDVLLAHTSEGIVAIDDRCPHMSAPLSIGVLDGCLVDCPLHNGQFDLRTGDATRMPTTGGLDADGTYHPVWTPEGKDPRPDPPGIKTEARRFTRVRRIRFYPVRVAADMIEVAVPAA
jgi:3-phenylpropionate/trans-cinnamate dioxygenase ferredoxin component